MKVVCKENFYKQLTKGKVYEVGELRQFPRSYSIVDDKGVRKVWDRNRFWTLSELRNLKLEELGI